MKSDLKRNMGAGIHFEPHVTDLQLRRIEKLEQLEGIDNDFHTVRKLTNSAKKELWIYSCSYQGRPRPIGYCSELCVHTSPDDAQRHYFEYLLDEATYEGRWLGVSYQCEICGKWGNGFAQLKSAFTIFRLCDDHLNRNALNSLLLCLSERKQ